jgi:hypothetical protein
MKLSKINTINKLAKRNINIIKMSTSINTEINKNVAGNGNYINI